MAGAIAEDRESCQFPFLLDEKPTVVPLRLDRRAVGRSARGTLWRRHRKSRKRQVAALFWSSAAKATCFSHSSVKSFPRSSFQFCPLSSRGAGRPSQVSVTQSVSGLFF